MRPGYHGQKTHRANGTDPIPVLIHLPVSGTSRRFVVTDDLGGTFLRSIQATLSTAGSTVTTVGAVKDPDGTNDNLLVEDVTIDSGDTTSYDAATPHEMDATGTPPTNYMLRGDVIEVTATKGTGASDLTVLLEFGPRIMRLTPP